MNICNSCRAPICVSRDRYHAEVATMCPEYNPWTVEQVGRMIQERDEALGREALADRRNADHCEAFQSLWRYYDHVSESMATDGGIPMTDELGHIIDAVENIRERIVKNV